MSSTIRTKKTHTANCIQIYGKKEEEWCERDKNLQHQPTNKPVRWKKSTSEKKLAIFKNAKNQHEKRKQREQMQHATNMKKN